MRISRKGKEMEAAFAGSPPRTRPGETAKFRPRRRSDAHRGLTSSCSRTNMRETADRGWTLWKPQGRGTATAALAIKGKLEFGGRRAIRNFSVQLGSQNSDVFGCELQETSKGQCVFPPGAGA